MAEHFVSTEAEENKTCVICTYCDPPVAAVKSCLFCESFLCDNHLRVHSQSPEHILLDLVASPKRQNDSFYKKALKHSTSTEDTACNEGSSTIDGERRDPHLEVVKEMAGLKEGKMRNFVVKSILRKMETVKKVQSLPQSQRGSKEILELGTNKDKVPFIDIMKHLKKKLLNGISSPEENISLSYQQPGIKKDKSSIKICPSEEPCIMTDPIAVLQEGHKKEGDNKTISMDIHHLKKEVYMEKASNMLLDINTVGNNVLLTSDLKSALWSVASQDYPKKRKRFIGPQVLSVSNFSTGKHYWKVETSKSGNWRVGMCYNSIARKGFRSYIGCNNKSWGFCKWNNQFSVMHNCKEVKLSHRLSCQSIGVYLDYEAGQLSFYELCDPIRHLHTFTATFTEPLHAVFRIWLDALGAGWVLLRS